MLATYQYSSFRNWKSYLVEKPKDMFLYIKLNDADYNSPWHALWELAHSTAKDRGGNICMEGTFIMVMIHCGVLFKSWHTQWQEQRWQIWYRGDFDLGFDSLRCALRELVHSMAGVGMTELIQMGIWSWFWFPVVCSMRFGTFDGRSRDGRFGTEGTLILVLIPCGLVCKNWLIQWQEQRWQKRFRRTLTLILIPSGVLYKNWGTLWLCGVLYENWHTRWQEHRWQNWYGGHFDLDFDTLLCALRELVHSMAGAQMAELVWRGLWSWF